MQHSIARLAGIAGLTLIGTSFAAAQDCPRGELDKAYCDRNGDLVADAPTDPKQLVNPMLDIIIVCALFLLWNARKKFSSLLN